MNTNNFLQLLEEDEEAFAQRRSQIEDSLVQTLGVFRFVGEIVDVFVPKVFDVLVAASGGQYAARQADPESSRTRPEIPSQGGIDRGRNIEPRRPGERDQQDDDDTPFFDR